MPRAQNYMLQEASTERVPEEGITHTTDPAARLWPVEVHFSTGLRPSRETVRATSAAQALEFIAARYRFADMDRTRVLEDAPAQVVRIRAEVPAAPIAPTPPPPAPEAASPPTSPSSTVQVVPGEKDTLGRTMVSPENARAAAILHATGQATWEDLARAIGCNRDNLRRKAARHKPQLQAAELIPPAPAPAAAGPFIGFLPSVGWAVVISSTADAMTGAGFTAVTTLQQASSGR